MREGTRGREGGSEGGRESEREGGREGRREGGSVRLMKAGLVDTEGRYLT